MRAAESPSPPGRPETGRPETGRPETGRPETGRRGPDRPGAPPWANGRHGPWRRPGPPGRQRRWPGPQVVAAVLFHLLGTVPAVRDGEVLRQMDVPAYALLLVGPLALAWLPRAPILVFVIASAATIGFATFAVPRWSFAVAPVIALFSAVKAGRRHAAVTVAAGGWLTYLLTTRVFADLLDIAPRARPDLRVLSLTAAGLALAVVLGTGAKGRAEHFAEMARARAEQARARVEQERRQASEERLRIARELHDVLGHHLSLINVQAGVGLHLMDNRPEQAREALTAIKTASAEALREVRAVLGVLRPQDEAAPRQPAVGLGRLAELTADAGLAVTTTVKGRPRDLPAAVDRAAYRIVQEALTNVRRHVAAGVAAHVTIDYRSADLTVTIRNDGPAAASAPGGPGRHAESTPEADGIPGSGIAGMRARAESLGGTLAAGSTPDGGFEVYATLPAVPASRWQPATAGEDANADAAGTAPSAAGPAAGDSPTEEEP